MRVQTKSEAKAMLADMTEEQLRAILALHNVILDADGVSSAEERVLGDVNDLLTMVAGRRALAPKRAEEAGE